MALTHSVVALNSSTAVQLNVDPTITDSVTGEKNPTWAYGTISVQNVDPSATVYLGASTVTSSSYGLKLIAGSSVTIDSLSQSSALYAISTGSSNVAVLMVTTA